MLDLRQKKRVSVLKLGVSLGVNRLQKIKNLLYIALISLKMIGDLFPNHTQIFSTSTVNVSSKNVQCLNERIKFSHLLQTHTFLSLLNL